MPERIWPSEGRIATHHNKLEALEGMVWLIWLLVGGLSPVLGCSSTRVMFLKFHKTGSESTFHYLRNGHVFDQHMQYWDRKKCPHGHFGHPALVTFADRGREGIRTSCLLVNPTDGCQSEHLYITTVLRDPLERLASYLFYFKSRLRRSFQ